MIETYLQCNNKFNNLYILGQAEKQNSSNLHFGSAMHTALKAHFDGEDPYTNFNLYWDSIKDNHLEYDRYSWEDLRVMAVDKFLPNFLRLHAKHFTKIKTEETLLVPIEDGHELQGTFDLCGDYNDELTMTDWKTSGSRYYLSKIYRNFQLYIYAYLYQKKYNVLPKFLMYKVFVKGEKSIQTIKIPLTQQRLDFMMNTVFTIIRDITNRKEWFCSGNPFCNCPGFEEDK